MIVVRLWADTHSTGLIDADGLAISREATSVTEATWAELQRWVEDYDVIIPLDEAERARRRVEIAALDARGERLLERVQAEWPRDIETGEPVQVLYWSEGTQGYR
jgi:hypothetical protein